MSWALNLVKFWGSLNNAFRIIGAEFSKNYLDKEGINNELLTVCDPWSSFKFILKIINYFSGELWPISRLNISDTCNYGLKKGRDYVQKCSFHK